MSSSQAVKAPPLNIPDSEHTVSVSIIDTTAHVSNIPTTGFMQPHVPGYDTLTAPCFSFLIKHSNPDARSKYDTLLFDLAIRKDWENGPPAVVNRAKNGGFKIKVEKNVVEVLEENGENPESVGGIIWSHWHWDHTGDPSTFPSNTDLIVGPGFTEAFGPGSGYPTKQYSPVAEDAYKDRTLREVDFSKESTLKLGGYRALDFYGDGSFYLLDSPGHAIGHICGLARTSAKEFIFMGGDIAHHGGEFRPTQYVPLPKEISPNPLEAPYSAQAPVCPGAMFEDIHPQKSSSEPFFKPASGEGAIHHNSAAAQESMDKLTEFDAYEEIFPMIAHDQSLFDVVEFFPKSANGWASKGWRREGRWRFLRDFDISK